MIQKVCSVCGGPGALTFSEPGLCDEKTEFCWACFADTFPQRLDIAYEANEVAKKKLSEH